MISHKFLRFLPASDIAYEQ